LCILDTESGKKKLCLWGKKNDQVVMQEGRGEMLEPCPPSGQEAGQLHKRVVALGGSMDTSSTEKEKRRSTRAYW
jgi:hypothetical protein